MTTIVTVQDRIERGDIAFRAQKNFADAIAAAEAEKARYDDMNAQGAYVSGGYVVMAENGLVLHRRGSPLRTQLAPSRDGLRSAQSFITMKEATKVVEAWNRDLSQEARAAGCGVKWEARTEALRRLIAQLSAEKAEIDKQVAGSDPYFDASPAAQDFDANEGRYL